jgi:hypothetical protein
MPAHPEPAQRVGCIRGSAVDFRFINFWPRRSAWVEFGTGSGHGQFGGLAAWNQASARPTRRCSGPACRAAFVFLILVQFTAIRPLSFNVGHHKTMNELIALLESDPNAANAFGALASAAAALLALLVSALSVWISVRAMSAQQKHNELSVRPLAEITVADYENSLRVKLRNNGTGPMIVSGIEISDGMSMKTCVVEWMPPLPTGRPWTTFSHDLKERTLQPEGEIVLLELTEYEGEHDFATCRESIRGALAPLTVVVSYTDIYNKAMPPRVKALAWFGRNK